MLVWLLSTIVLVAATDGEGSGMDVRVGAAAVVGETGTGLRVGAIGSNVAVGTDVRS